MSIIRYTVYTIIVCVFALYNMTQRNDRLFLLMMNTRFDIVTVEFLLHIQSSAIEQVTGY